MLDNADPIEGWSYSEFTKNSRAAKNDTYGALFYYLQQTFAELCSRINLFHISFEVFSMNAMQLPQHFQCIKSKWTFDRIEVCVIVSFMIYYADLV